MGISGVTMASLSGSARGAAYRLGLSNRLLTASQSQGQSQRKMSSDFLKKYAQIPALPVPPLEQTLSKYLRTVQPLASAAEYAITEQAAKDFAAKEGNGVKLHQMLVKKGSKEINWLSSWWLDAAYLTYRLPVVVHSSPGLVFPKQRFDAFDDQLTYAAKLIVGALHYKAIVDGAKLKQDYLGKNPLCMAQYTKVFSGCRIPGLPKDSIRQCHDAQHIVVAFNNHFFKVVVTDELGRIPSTAAILQALRHLVRHVPQPSHPVGVLTTESRDTWAAVYPKLLKDEGNAASLKAIEDSMFVMCLDKANDSLPTEMTLRSRMASQLLHGLGSHNNSGNRWFDKTLQLIVGADGTNGLCYEHSPAEGPPMANLADFIVDFAAKESVPSQLGVDISSVEHLGFQLTLDLVEDVAKASHNIDALAADVDMNSFTFDAYGKEEIKGLKFSPDSFIQVALQTAFIRVHGHPTAHYESASTRKFAEGRTDTIRSCLPEIANFASCLLGKTNASEREKYAALQAAVQSHKDYVQAVRAHLSSSGPSH